MIWELASKRGFAMRKAAILLALGGFLAGCAPDIYDKEGVTQADFNVDMGNCQMFAMGVPQAQAPYVPPTYTTNTTYNASYGYGQINGSAMSTTTPDNSGQAMANLGTAIGNSLRERNALRSCMASRGYTRRQR